MPNIKRISLRTLLVITAASLVACSENGFAPDGQAADLVFTGRNIITMDEAYANPRAVAVRGDTIIAVGTEKQVLALRDKDTRVIELGDRALVPGFIDAHGHLAMLARFIEFVNLSSPPVGPVQDIEDIVRLLQNHIEENHIPPGQWVMGYGYDDSLLREKRHPTREDLDLASPEHPIVLLHVSAHLAAVNSIALERKGIDSATANPPGGVIRRQPGSEAPNGVLEETAAFPFMMEMGRVTESSLGRLLYETARHYASFGITTVQDGAATPDDIVLFSQLAGENPFPVDIVAYPTVMGWSDEQLDGLAVSAEYRGGFRIGGAKLVLDGSPQGRTAFLSRPYNEGPPGSAADYRAYPSLPAEVFNPLLARLMERKIPVLVHANGDAAIDMVIEGTALAQEEQAIVDHRTVIIHAQLMRDDQLPKVKRLGLLPSYYAAHPFFWGDWHRKSFGDDRASFISPLASTEALAIPYTIHNDAPVVPPDMLRLMSIAVNRKTRSGFILGPGERVTPLQALRAVTLGAAYQYFEEDSKGSITPGKKADLVVLGRNPLAVDPGDIQGIAVLETFSAGKSVFQGGR